MGDIDHFKSINDTYGHPFGDQILKKLAEIMLDTVRVVDMAARYGGEEFVLILENSEVNGGLQIAERIRSRLAGLKLFYKDQPVTVTISFGLAVFPDDGAEKSTLITKADQALYAAKRRGRNRVLPWHTSFAGKGDP